MLEQLMRLAIQPDNFSERFALRIVPPGILEGWVGMMMARTIVAATRLGVLDTLQTGELTCNQVARTCHTELSATRKLLNALVGIGCVRRRGDTYRLVDSAQASGASREDCYWDQTLLHFAELRWWNHCEEYLRTGRSADVHESMSDEEWGIYQRGMRAGIRRPAEWVARNLPVPKSARTMLDVGGAHGVFSREICRRHPKLQSIILDLPDAVRHAERDLLDEGVRDRVQYCEGDVFQIKLGAEAYDVIFLGSLVHHFDERANRALMKRLAHALRPGGLVAIWEPLREDRAGRVHQLGSLLDLFFGLCSDSGTWSADEICDWMAGAGLTVDRPRHPRMLREFALMVGRKSLRKSLMSAVRSARRTHRTRAARGNRKNVTLRVD